ncbi:MAG: hydroxysqualene dehydroxylase HpnE [Sphingomonadales bacterium]|nr:hydroxysqualene dehydroxylase HpnE [Sphingomonadales bacterium]
MSERRATVVGAGLAGLGAAVAFARAGVRVAISDAALRAGGRCRSYPDPTLGLTIDNGNHLVLAGNAAVADFRAAVGAKLPLAGPRHADFAFADCAAGTAWRIAINDGRLPWWIAAGSRRVPGTRIGDYLPLRRLLAADSGTIGDHLRPEGAVWTQLLRPVLLAALNTEPEDASARLAGAVLRETLGRGGAACAPRVAVPGLGAAFIDPALGWLARHGAPLATGRRLRGLGFSGDVVSRLAWSDGEQRIHRGEVVVLAVPPWIAAELVPQLCVPDAHRAIVNAHFAVPLPRGAPSILGVLGATSEWIFGHTDRVSVTVSAADRLLDAPREALAARIWEEVRAALALAGGAPLPAPLPAWQIVKERRATFAATPAQDARRPVARTRWRNLFLAGDWVQTGLPATIEGALRSGDNAARLAMRQPLRYGPQQ